MKIDSKWFRVGEGMKVSLREWPTRVAPVFGSDKDYEKIMTDHIHAMGTRQKLLYASNQYAVLLIFQAMDALPARMALLLYASDVRDRRWAACVFSYKHPDAGGTSSHDFSVANDARLCPSAPHRHLQSFLL